MLFFRLPIPFLESIHAHLLSLTYTFVKYMNRNIGKIEGFWCMLVFWLRSSEAIFRALEPGGMRARSPLKLKLTASKP